MVEYREVQVLIGDTWHMASQDSETGILTGNPQCNLDASEHLELYPDIPEWVKAADLCKRCHPTVSER